MLLGRLLIEFHQERRWVTFHKKGAVDQPFGFRLDDAFDTSDVVAAACATGWVVRRNDDCWVSSKIDCEALGDFVNEMLFYFFRSGEPRPELVRLREHIKQFWNDGDQPQSPLSLWASAYLDLKVRERLAEQARQAEDVLGQPVLQLSVHTELRECVCELAARYAKINEAAQDLTRPRKMAPSRRTLSRHVTSEKDVG